MEVFTLKYVNQEHLTNQVSHETQGLSSKHLVVRRGKPFKITLLFKGRPFSPAKDCLIFKVLLGDLYAEFPATLEKSQSQSQWNAGLLSGSSTHCNSVTVCIFPPPHASVGLYDLHLYILAQSWVRRYKIGEFVLLCNPWCPADLVYIHREDLREEYVKNDFGLLYVGTAKNVERRPWEFDQYEEGVLETCLNLLQISPQHRKNRKMDYLRRSDPVYLSRVVCAMINCQDDKGILQGNWTGDFQNGVNPSHWTGSADILKQWAKSNFNPVCYGQCWVYAAVMCTVMRVLGIPCRVITNFNSAHDTNGNLVIEEYYDEMGKKLHMSKDSIWNFHVWVECWMARPDLASGFDGWQVLDPTPQERSGGVYCCGPSPVRGIRERRLDLIYDIPFVYAEVNADVHTVIVRNGQALARRVDTERVGAIICTKSLGSDLPQNVTEAYKNPKVTALQFNFPKVLHKNSNSQAKEYNSSPQGTFRQCNMLHSAPGLGSSPERTTIRPRSRRSDYGVHQGLEVSLSLDKVPVAGETISFSVTVSNKDNAPKIQREYLNAQAKEYNSSPLETFWEYNNLFHIAPYEVKTITHQIHLSQYEEMLLGDGLVNLAVVIEDQNSHERVLATEEFNITNPEISIQVTDTDDIVINEEHTARFVFTNPYHVTMNGVLTVKGAGLLKGSVQVNVNLQPGETMEKTITFSPKMAGTKMLHANLVFKNSPIVIRGFRTILVKEA